MTVWHVASISNNYTQPAYHEMNRLMHKLLTQISQLLLKPDMDLHFMYLLLSLQQYVLASFYLHAPRGLRKGIGFNQGWKLRVRLLFFCDWKSFCHKKELARVNINTHNICTVPLLASVITFLNIWKHYVISLSIVLYHYIVNRLFFKL